MYESQRENLTVLLRKKGIQSRNILDAIQKVERHLFVPEIMIQHAYDDVALPIGYGQTISQPYTVALMTQYLEINKNEKILEIGTGSGYQAAILYSLGAKVFSIERSVEIYNRTIKLMDELNYRIVMRCGDGTIGWSDHSPFDKIIVTAGGPSIPKSLKNQLALGGRMVIPIGDRKSQSLKIIDRISDKDFQESDIPNFTFVPLIGKEGWKKE